MKTTKIFAAACAAALALPMASPALAAQVIFNNSGTNSSNNIGNVRTYSQDGINVQVSAWSVQNGTTLEKAFLGSYPSLGVTNNDEGNGSANNSHTIDNVGQLDFVLLLFDQAVNIVSAKLNPFDVTANGINDSDNDAMVSFATLQGNVFTNPPTSLSVNDPVWSALAANQYEVAGNNSSNALSLNSAGKVGNAWVIGASALNRDGRADGFKLESIKVNSAVAAVPEPGTWAMMLIGFGLLGATMRRRKTTTQVGFRFA